MRPRCIVRDTATFRRCHGELAAGDVVACRLGLHAGEEALFCDLLSRGVHCVPSALAQLCSRSKVLQAQVAAAWLPPHTTAVHDLHGLMAAINDYAAAGIATVICKLDRANAGMGVLRFADIELLYAAAVGGRLAFPLVLQPFLAGAVDVRVLRLGDYTEAYRRHNPHSWRHNLHCGGQVTVHALSGRERALCDQVMARAGFPYAHIDLLLTPDGGCYLGEINLRGGIRGAAISPAAYRERVRRLDEDLLRQLSQEDGAVAG